MIATTQLVYEGLEGSVLTREYGFRLCAFWRFCSDLVRCVELGIQGLLKRRALFSLAVASDFARNGLKEWNRCSLLRVLWAFRT